MVTIKLNMPPDKTPEEEAAIVSAVARSFEDSTGSTEVTIEVNKPEEVDYKALETDRTSRWSG